MKSLSNFLDICPDNIKDRFINLKFNPLDKIILQNEKCNYVYILKNGKAKVYSLTSNGIKYLEHIHNEYELFGEIEIFLDKPTLSYVEALNTCEIIKIPKDCFFEWISSDKDFSLYVNIQLAEKMYNTCVNTKTNIVYPLKYRFLFFLWKFSTDYNLLFIHKDILVEGIGSNIRSVNRVIKELCNDGIIEYNKGLIRIKDLNKIINLMNEYL